MMLFVLCKACESLNYSILQVFRQHPAATCFPGCTDIVDPDVQLVKP